MTGEALETLPIVRLLLRYGYAIEWHPAPGDAPEDPARRLCVVSDLDETFEGRGADERAALEDAIQRLAPSKVARTLIDRAAKDLPAQFGSAEVPVLHGGPDAASNGPRDLRAILADLQLVAARVEAGIPEAALMAPPLQKLHVLAWIARARMLEHEAGRNRSASDATAAIARRLTTLCKTWWPGSVRALQVDATPERASREQGLPPATRWLEVAESAEARLEQLIAEPPSDDGWRDMAALTTPPDDATPELAVAVKTIEQLIAPIDVPPSNDAPKPLTQNDELRLEDAAARLRWSRHVAPDPERWGAAIGRLRWLVAQRKGGARLAKLIDATHSPRPSWEIEAHVVRSRLVALTAPPEGASELLAWLLAAFDAVDGPSLAKRLRDLKTASGQPVAPLVLQIKETDLPPNDRRMRRRLRHLHELMRGTALELASSPSGSFDLTPPMMTPDPEGPIHRPSHDERTFQRVREKLRDVSALFISNREDPMLRERLERALGWQIEWSTSEPRRIASIAGAIARGKYKVVLSATGFQDHATDITLARAAAGSGTLYVRVNRGRSAACARALARELGIRDGDIATADTEQRATG
jgi:hypothetical protein